VDAAAVSGTAAAAAHGTSSSCSHAAATAAGAAAAAASIAAPSDIVGSGGAWLLPALSRAFVALDHEFGALSEGKYVGTTAVVVLLSGGRLWVAHCGDSRAVLGRSGGLQVLTSDHKASRGDEVARVQVGCCQRRCVCGRVGAR
jgi:protein phosphatase 2C